MRICYLLAKYYKEQGLNNLGIRQKIFEWGKINNIYFPFSVNSIIYGAVADTTKLRGETPVYISQADIDAISMRFDKKKCKYVALAILCYAKVTANRENEVVISTISLGNWLGIHQQHISGRYIPELIDFDFMERIGEEESYFTWDKDKPISKNRRYKMKVNLENNKENAVYELNNNDIGSLCKEIFG